MRIRLLDPSIHPRFDDLPWDRELELWTHPRLVELPSGLHRHVVRFVDYDGQVYVLKELAHVVARREFGILRSLNEMRAPVVRVVALVDQRGADLDAVVITRFLNYALPYRYLYERTEGEPTSELVSSLAGLLARLHVAGFFWGDCSLSNSLFRRDGSRLTAYALDMETSEQRPRLTDGQRELDVETAEINIAGGLADLSAAGRLPEEIDPFEVALQVGRAYRDLWAELHRPDVYRPDAPEPVEDRLERLHDLGFDVAEAVIVGDGSGFVFEPVAVEEGFSRRELHSLTGIVAREQQAKRLLGELGEFAVARGLALDDAARRWVLEEYQRILDEVPDGLIGKLEPAQIVIEVLDHRAEIERSSGHAIPASEAAAAYVQAVLEARIHEKVIVTDDD